MNLFGWLGGLGAINSTLFWGGIGAVSIPVIIHLLNRRRYRTLKWAAMEFLLEAQRANRKRVRIEHLLVLFLRCLAVALVVATVARPVTTRGALAALPGARDQVERVLVVDDSGSTTEREGDRSAFDEEKRLTKELLDDLGRERPGDLVTIVRGSRAHRPDLIRSEAKSGRTEDVARRIDDWKPTHMRFALHECLSEVLGAERGGEKDKGSALRRFVYVLSDFRRSDWLGALDEKEQKELEKQGASSRLQLAARTVKAAGAGVSFIVIDAGHDDPTNVGVVDLAPQEKLVVTGIPEKLVARVKNWGKAPAHDVALRLIVGTNSVPVAPIPLINGGETKEVEISYTFAEPGRVAATVELTAGDRMPADDRRFLALEVVKAVRVLLVDGRPTDDPYESQTFYLERALQPPGEVKSGVETVTIPVERLADEDLSSYHAIILCDLDRFPAQRLPALERYVHDGGGLAIFLGDEVDPQAYESELWVRHLRETDKDGKSVERSIEGAGLLPCRLGELKGPFAESPKLAVPSLDHPLLRVFQGENNPFLSRVKSRRHFGLKIDPQKDPTTRPIAHWEDPESTPALVEKAFGDGRVVLLNTTASRAWTDWPREISFPITAQELVRYLAPDSKRGANFEVGTIQTRAINPGVYEPKALLTFPDDPTNTAHELLAARDARPGEGSDALVFTFPEATMSGVYTLELKPRAPGVPARREAHAALMDPREGDLEKADASQVSKILEGEGVKVQIAKSAGHSLLALTEGERNELWRTAAWFLLIVLAIEALAALRAAHHGSAASVDEVDAARGVTRAAGADTKPIGLPRAGSPAPGSDRPTALPTVGGRS